MNNNIDSSDFSIVVDAGGFAKGRSSFSDLQNQYLLGGLEKLGYSVINLSTRDFQIGAEFLQELDQQHEFDFISANAVYSDSDELFTNNIIYRKLDVQGTGRVVPFRHITIGFLGLCDERGRLTYSRMQDETENSVELKSIDPVNVAVELVPQMQRKADLVVLLFNGKLQTVEAIADQIDGIDIVIMGGEYYRASSYNRHSPILATTPSLGKYGAMLTLELDKNYQIVNIQRQRQALSEKVPDNPELAEWVSEFERKKKEQIQQQMAN